MIVGMNALRDIGRDVLEPFRERYTVNGLSGGLSSAGYDVAVEFDGQGEIQFMTLAPGQFQLASTIEYFRMPDDLVGIVHDKSTLARMGLAVQNTVIEPGWSGHLTLELTNHGYKDIDLERGQPIAQIIFHRVEGAVPYTGKYNRQARGPVGPR